MNGNKLIRLGCYCLALIITGCGGGDSSSVGSASSSEDTTASVDTVDVGGSVGDGPITGATVKIYNNKGKQIAAVLSDHTATYKSRVKAKGSEYPLVLEVVDGTDLVTGGAPDFKLSSAMMSPKNKVVHINPASTLIVMTAKAMPGGLSSENITKATAYITNQLGFGLDPDIFSNPITSEINDENIANIVKSSEALGEMVRRTRDQITAAGTVISGDYVMKAIAADMTDGYLDGQGAAGTDPTVAAVANVASGQVLIEALSNNLRVGGVIATGVIDYAIIATRPQILSSQLTASVRTTSGMLKQARVSLSAAQAIDSSSQIADMLSTIDSINDGSLAEEITPVLPADSYMLLDNAVVLSSIATEEDTNAINEAVHTTSSTGGTGTVNTAPVISGSPAGLVTANVAYSFQPDASDADADPLTFSIRNKPAWASFSTGSGRLSGTPTDSHVGSHSNIVISVTDGTDTVSLPGFSIQVAAAPVVNTAPVISGSPAGSVTANAAYSFQPGASDADGDKLTFSIRNKPAWASFSTGSGRLSGTPTDSHVGSHSNIVISVTDGADTVSLPAFSIQVAAAPVVNTAPVISGNPAGSVTANEAYSFQPGASDADGDKLTFSIRNKPVWASFSTGSGRLSGTPTDSHVGSHSNIVISVTDGTDTVSLPAFSIQVAAAPVVNTAPVISGNPAGSVTANEAYSFQPGASDADGDKLTFSIRNKPAWASFSTGSGRLSGTPADSHEGSYNNIVISVTDGTDTVSLPAFSIQVAAAPVQTGSFSVSWTAPVTHADGAPLSLADIGGYRIYFGNSSGSYTDVADLNDGAATSATVSGVPLGSTYAVMTTYDATGRESGYSQEISKIVQ